MFIPKITDIIANKSQFRGTTRLWQVDFYTREEESGFTYNLSPSYQRPDVWTTEQRCNFIRSIFFGLPIPPVVLNLLGDEREEKEGFRFNVIDGKQRLTTLQMFSKDQLEVDGLKWSDLPEGARRRFGYHALSAIETRFETEEEEAEYYEVFNYGGTSHGTYTIEEISKALSTLSKIYQNKSDKEIEREGGMTEKALYISENVVGMEMARKMLPKILSANRNKKG